MYANLGTLALARGHKDQARPHYEAALKRDPKFGIAHWMLGRIAMEENQWKQAEKHLTDMIESNPKDVRGYLDLSETHIRAGDRASALKALLMAQPELPHHPLILQRMMQLRGVPTGARK